VLTPLLQAAHALEVASIPASLLALVADAMDEMAEACRPSADAFTNPAKALAVEFAESFALIAGAGQLAGVAAGCSPTSCSCSRSARGRGQPPRRRGPAGALLVGEPQDSFDDEFFPATVSNEPQGVRPRLVTIGDDGERGRREPR